MVPGQARGFEYVPLRIVSGRRTARTLLTALALLPTLSPSGLAGQLTFRRAVELAAQHSAALALASADLDKSYEACEETPTLSIRQMAAVSIFRDLPYFPPVAQHTLSPAVDLSARQFFIESATSSLIKPTDAERPESMLMRSAQRRYAELCTAIFYAELDEVNSQIQVLQRQEVAAERLLKIEARRVVARVDNPVVLTRARLLAAQTQMWTACLDGSALRLRRLLADLTGLPEDEIEAVPDSMPLLPDVSTTDPEMQMLMGELLAARNVAQLEHVLARTQRMSTRGKMVVGKANLGDLVADYITEDEKLVVLLELNFAFERAQLRLLQATGGLEKWALDDTDSGSESVAVATAGSVMVAAPATRVSQAEQLTVSPTVKSIMITPAVSSLTTGQSQKFSAIAIYGDGSAKDATSDARWRCSSNSDAIVSTSGLVTALAKGQVTISATVSGVSELRQITITSDDSVPF